MRGAIFRHWSGPENGSKRLGVRPGAIVLQDFLGWALLAPLLVKIVERLAAGEACAALLVPEFLGFLDAQLAALRIVSETIDLLRGPIRNDVFHQIFENEFWISFERIAVTGPPSAEAEEQIAFFINLGRARDQLVVPVSVDRALLHDFAVVHRQLWLSFTHLLQQVGLPNANPGDGCRCVSTEQGLAERDFASVTHAHRNKLGDFVDHPMLGSSGATPMASGAARILPMLREGYGYGQFALDLFGIGRAPKRAPGESVRIHAVGARAAALALGIESKGKNVRKGKIPLRMARTNLRSVLAARRSGDLLPQSRTGKRHFGEGTMGRAASLHAYENTATGGGHTTRIDDSAFGENKINGRKSGAADRQVVKNVLVHEVGDVADNGLRMNVVGGRIFRRGAVEIEGNLAAARRQGQITSTHEGRRPANGVIEDNYTELAVGQGLQFLAGAGLRSVRHFPKQTYEIRFAALFDNLQETHANAIGGSAARAKVGDKHGWRTEPIDGVKLQEIIANLEILANFDRREIQAFLEA